MAFMISPQSFLPSLVMNSPTSGTPISTGAFSDESEIVRDLVSQMYAHKETPTKAFCTDVAEQFVSKYPFTKDAGAIVTGYVSCGFQWENMLVRTCVFFKGLGSER